MNPAGRQGENPPSCLFLYFERVPIIIIIIIIIISPHSAREDTPRRENSFWQEIEDTFITITTTIEHMICNDKQKRPKKPSFVTKKECAYLCLF